VGLKIIRYRNYGKAMEAIPNENNIIQNNFYWCFFELNNGSILDLNLTENYDEKGNDLGDDYYVSYADDYTFELTFTDWFDGTFKRPKDKPIYKVTDEEYDFIKDFYNKNIYQNRDKETEIEYI
jgi:hypothetical protein